MFCCPTKPSTLTPPQASEPASSKSTQATLIVALAISALAFVASIFLMCHATQVLALSFLPKIAIEITAIPLAIFTVTTLALAIAVCYACKSPTIQRRGTQHSIKTTEEKAHKET